MDLSLFKEVGQGQSLGLNVGNLLDKPGKSATGSQKLGDDEGAVGGSSSAASMSLNGFGQLLKTELDKVNTLQVKADRAAETYATGGDIQVHSVMIALEKAETSMQMAVQVRNKLVSAYQEISRMQL